MFKKIVIGSMIIILDLITIGVPLGSIFLFMIILDKSIRNWFFNILD